MKNIPFKILLILMCAPLFSTAHNGPKWNGKYTKEKTIKKEFKVDAEALLKLDNSYGNLFITSWDQNTTTIEVHIQTNSNNEKRAQEKLDEIDIIFESSNAMASAKTVFENNRWGWNNNNVSMEINYTVKVPINNRLDLNNDYGSIYLDEINGVTTIQCEYGSMKIGKLNAESNELNLEYTTDVNIEYINKASINADYSKYTIERAGHLDIEADYSNSTINEVTSVQYSCDYGNITIGKATDITGDGDYLNGSFGSVHGDVKISCDYGKLKIREMAQDAGNMDIDCDYTHVEIGYNSAYHFDFTTELEYAGFDGDTDFEYSIKREKSSDSYYQGYHGSAGKNTVHFNIEYGGLKLNKL